MPVALAIARTARRFMALGLVAAGAIACLVPALRAARLDAAAILREP